MTLKFFPSCKSIQPSCKTTTSNQCTPKSNQIAHFKAWDEPSVNRVFQLLMIQWKWFFRGCSSVGKQSGTRSSTSPGNPWKNYCSLSPGYCSSWPKKSGLTSTFAVWNARPAPSAPIPLSAWKRNPSLVFDLQPLFRTSQVTILKKNMCFLPFWLGFSPPAKWGSLGFEKGATPSFTPSFAPCFLWALPGPEHISDRMRRMPDRVSEPMSNRMSQNMSHRMPDKVECQKMCQINAR